MHTNKEAMNILRKPKLVIIFFAFTFLSLNLIPSSASHDGLPYAEHCASVVPESDSKLYRPLNPIAYKHTGYYHTAADTANKYFYHQQVRNSIEFDTWHFGAADAPGLIKLKAALRVESTSTFYHVGNSSSSQPQYPGYRTRSSPGNQRSVEFRLRGFWSESSGNLCMVGYDHTYSKQLRQITSHQYPVALKLYNVMNSSSATRLITGTLESLIKSSNLIKDASHFDPISILMLPKMNYQYTLVSNNSNDSSSLLKFAS